jgi:hypothetical protein
MVDGFQGLPDNVQRSAGTVLVGDDPHPVSIQTIQEIFKELTGKNEVLSENFSKPYQIEFGDIENLYHRLGQTLEQYNVISSNFSATVYYVDDTKDQLRSFERLKLQNGASTSPVESLFIKYDLLIMPYKLQRSQSYTISITINSRIAIDRRLRDETFPTFPTRLMRLFAGPVAALRIEYIDYTVAKSLQTVVKEWFSAIHYDN